VRSLFEDRPVFDRDHLAERLASLAQRRIFLGASSWKYPGWLAQIYTPERYASRGKFSKKRFESECIAEYAEVFPIVCGDFAFYQFPTADFWSNLFGRTPERFQFALKVPEQITRMEFPDIPRYGAQAGQKNTSFLDAGLLKSAFLDPLEPHRKRLAPIIFEFGPLPRADAQEPAKFLEALDRFLKTVPAGFRMAVEVRNPELLVPAYFDCLRKHGVAHVYTAWARMPDLSEQIAMPGSKTADFIVCRALLRRGRGYDQAVKLFSPYSEIRERYAPAREGIRELIQNDSLNDVLRYIFVNNRLEGNAPSTIEAVIAGVRL
jgi:uncharacterized protein YecE (DUF72 family)